MRRFVDVGCHSKPPERWEFARRVFPYRVEIMPQYKRIGIFLQPPFSQNGAPLRREPTGRARIRKNSAARAKGLCLFFTFYQKYASWARPGGIF
ncbi:hypothetical protein HMPREF7215_2044 [Pyramidobacter piscolens W5455]|uniref:Uncharacterized protein n=1 Tax=Pyramidobacter piscolens W5455 TaxID=352165 RepID=A0ABM9ZXT2_9BACT|nr:hypothetical protein HMPREF7215_2044 [Pyramidobacter piscolens W5455]